MGKKLTTEEFVSKAKNIHGDKYLYKLVDYNGMENLIKIICPVHGIFEQKPRNHLDKSGCSECGLISFKNKKTISQEVALNRLLKLYGNKYDYSLFEYNGINSKIKVICKIHGIFEPTYLNHYHSKTECPLCQFKDKEYYLNKCKELHKNKYCYDDVDYNCLRDKVKIICKIHGVFLQRFSAHIDGQNCPSCVSYISKEEINWLNSFKNLNIIRQYKIDKHFVVDGYDPETNTVYQYHGVYWHGHPDFYDSSKKHPHFKNKTFGVLYQRTLERDEKIKKLGYNLITKWSHQK